MNFLTNLLCACPPATALEAITIPDCFEDFGQIQRVFVCRLYDGTTANSITTAAGITLAGWTALKGAADSTKVVTSPIVFESNLVAGEKNEYGGGNETPSGIPIPLATNPSTFTGVFRQVAQESIRSLKKLRCEPALGAYLVNEQGQIAGAEEVSGTLTPFPIYGFFVGDKGTGNRDTPDGNAIEFYLKANWSDYFSVIQPSDFDALATDVI